MLNVVAQWRKKAPKTPKTTRFVAGWRTRRPVDAMIDEALAKASKAPKAPPKAPKATPKAPKAPKAPSQVREKRLKAKEARQAAAEAKKRQKKSCAEERRAAKATCDAGKARAKEACSLGEELKAANAELRRRIDALQAEVMRNPTTRARREAQERAHEKTQLEAENLPESMRASFFAAVKRGTIKTPEGKSVPPGKRWERFLEMVEGDPSLIRSRREKKEELERDAARAKLQAVASPREKRAALRFVADPKRAARLEAEQAKLVEKMKKLQREKKALEKAGDFFA